MFTIECEFSQLTGFERRVLAVSRRYRGTEYTLMLTRVGRLFLNNVAMHTPVKTGRLRRSFHPGGRDNVMDRVAHDTIMAGTNVEYGPFVEHGHHQDRRWVPGHWAGNTFVYEPGASTGMMLTNRFVPGQHMVEKGAFTTKRGMTPILQRFIRSLLNDLGGGS